MISVCSKPQERGKPRTGDVEVRPADETLLVLSINAVNDETVDEALQEDGGSASSAETSTGVAEVHAVVRNAIRRCFSPRKKGKRKNGPSPVDLTEVALVQRLPPHTVALGISGSVELRPERVAVGEDAGNCAEKRSQSERSSPSAGARAKR